MRKYGRQHAQATKRKAGYDTESDEESRKRSKPAPAPLPSPTKIPRDLSQIFDELTAPVSPSASPGKVAKRMLGRSKTESSIESGDSPSSSLSTRTPSLPTILSPSASVSRPAPPLPLPTLSFSQPSTPKRSSSSKRTYAGKSRSFLVALPVEGTTEDPTLTRESYSVLRERWGIDISEDDPFSSVASASNSNVSTPSASPKKGKSRRPAINPLKSQSELKHKGETQRFLDEVGYLLEGMDTDAGAGLRRTSALDIANHLGDVEFSRKAKAADFIGQTWDAFMETDIGTGADKLYDIIFTFFAAVISRDATSLTDVARRSNLPSTSDSSDSQFSATLFSLLNRSNDPLEILDSEKLPDGPLRKIGIKKNDSTLLKSIHSSIRKTSLFPRHTPLSTHLLVTHTLCALPPTFLSTTHLPSLLDSLRSHLHSRKDIDTTRNLLRLLDSYLLGQWRDDQSRELLDDARGEWLLPGLVSFAVKNETALQGEDCMDMILRVLVSLTHGDEKWCGQVLKHEAGPLFVMRTIARADSLRHEKAKVKREEESNIEEADARLLDRLCLALALFTNLVQEVHEAKDVLRDLLLDPSCTACLTRCTCSQPTSALNVLVQVYLHQLLPVDPQVKPELDPEPFAASADASFLLGHLSVLFGLLMKGSEDNQMIILDRLGGQRRERIDGMVENAAELAAFYAVISGRDQTEGLESRIEREGSKGEDVAKDVIKFLMELRNS
ncbi:hypothetical protein BDZ89DRAFT_1065654 [Hymenopellis radicata]|nr:hypothetical protein BDZ89DRAFT_1065654 [Hymenopellis radicata]